MGKVPQYTNECYRCKHNWLSWYDDEPCPECGEEDNVGTDYMKEVNNETTTPKT